LYEIIILGKGGQGAVLAATLLANTAARSGCQAQAFASYGAERRGGRVESYIRIADEKISIHSRVYRADLLVLMDESLAADSQLSTRLKQDALVLINTREKSGRFPFVNASRILTLDANRIAIARGLILPSGIPIINTTILGAVVALVPLLKLESLEMALQEGKIPSPGKNIGVAREAYRLMKSHIMPAGSIKSEIDFDSIQETYPEYCLRLPPCTAACPAGEDIERTAYHIQQGQFDEALRNIRDENPFPGICGRVCFHPCQGKCNRLLFDEAVSIRALERAAFDYADKSRLKEIKTDSPGKKRVAVIGAGPAGLTCAYYLTLSGHRVTLFESASEPGGIPRWGIPAFRLPSMIVQEEVRRVLENVIDIKTSTCVGIDISFEEIRKNYQAVFIATGAHLSLKLGVAGEDLEGVLSGLEFLKLLNSGRRPDLGERVAVIGGGNVAVDAALSALRLGARDVAIVCLEKRGEMPAYTEGVIQAEAEGVRVLPSSGVKTIIGSGRRVCGIELITCTSVYDNEGKLNPVFDEKDTRVLPLDTVIVAIGQIPDLTFLFSTGLKVGRILEVNRLTMETTIPGVFAGGDVSGFSHSIVEAIADGKKAAISIDLYLKGERPEQLKAYFKHELLSVSAKRYLSDTRENEYLDEVVEFADLNLAYFDHQPAEKPSRLQLEASRQGFQEIESGFSREQAVSEAARCFHCGRCTLCENCYIFCPDLAVKLKESGDGFEIVRQQCKTCGICINECPRAAISRGGDRG